MEHSETPMMDFIREVIIEHTVPLSDSGSGVVEAPWLVDMLFAVKGKYSGV